MAQPSFYILHGNDSISIDDALAKMRAALGENGTLNTSELDGSKVTVPEVLSAAKSLPFLCDKRLVIVRSLLSQITRKGAGKAGKKAVDRLLAELPQLPASARLVFVEPAALPARSRLLKAAAAMDNGYISKRDAPKNLTSWIRRRAQDAYDSEIDGLAAQALASLAQQELLVADSELFKLVCFVQGQRAINEDDVAALTPYVPEANVFDMVDALASGDGKRAMSILHAALRDDPRDPGFRLFALIVRQFRLLLMTRDIIDRGGSTKPEALAKSLAVHPFVARKLAQQARRFQSAQLDRILKRLQTIDESMKLGRVEPRLALDLLTASLASR